MLRCAELSDAIILVLRCVARADAIILVLRCVERADDMNLVLRCVERADAIILVLHCIALYCTCQRYYPSPALCCTPTTLILALHCVARADWDWARTTDTLAKLRSVLPADIPLLKLLCRLCQQRRRDETGRRV